MNRGACHQRIFSDESDYQYFMSLLLDTRNLYSFIVHAYCLMTNHYHLLIETKDEDISKIMKRINEFYTRYYNVKYGRDGALFRGRFKSCEVLDDEYFLQTSRYICLNPVNARIVELPEQYKWSSYSTLVGLTEEPITECDKTLRYFKDKNKQLYREFVESRIRYGIFEEQIAKEMGEDELWLPW